MAIPYYSTEGRSDQPQVRFLEVPAADGVPAPNAIRIWFYPGNSVGHECIWPRDKAMALARATSQSVLTTKTADAGRRISAHARTGDEIDFTNVDSRRRVHVASHVSLVRTAGPSNL